MIQPCSNSVVPPINILISIASKSAYLMMKEGLPGFLNPSTRRKAKTAKMNRWTALSGCSLSIHIGTRGISFPGIMSSKRINSPQRMLQRLFFRKVVNVDLDYPWIWAWYCSGLSKSAISAVFETLIFTTQPFS